MGPSLSGVLLDTNALLWLLTDPNRMNSGVLGVLEDPATEVFVSTASAWEVAIKSQSGRLDGDALLSSWDDIMEAADLRQLPIDAGDAIAAGMLAWEHRDPFDRMIVAQATRRGLSVATSDRQLQAALIVEVLDTRRA